MSWLICGLLILLILLWTWNNKIPMKIKNCKCNLSYLIRESFTILNWTGFSNGEMHHKAAYTDLHIIGMNYLARAVSDTFKTIIFRLLQKMNYCKVRVNVSSSPLQKTSCLDLALNKMVLLHHGWQLRVKDASYHIETWQAFILLNTWQSKKSLWFTSTSSNW